MGRHTNSLIHIYIHSNKMYKAPKPIERLVEGDIFRILNTWKQAKEKQRERKRERERKKRNS